jgi:hypothetical protein
MSLNSRANLCLWKEAADLNVLAEADACVTVFDEEVHDRTSDAAHAAGLDIYHHLTVHHAWPDPPPPMSRPDGVQDLNRAAIWLGDGPLVFDGFAFGVAPRFGLNNAVAVPVAIRVKHV